MSTEVMLVREDDPTVELGSGCQVEDGLVVAEATPALALLERASAVFPDGTRIAGDVQRYPAGAASLLGLDLDEPGPVVAFDLAQLSWPSGPGDLARTDDPAVAEMRAVVERVLGRAVLVVSVEAEPGEPLFPEASVTDDMDGSPGEGVLFAAAGRVRSPFCWLFPRSRFCR